MSPARTFYLGLDYGTSTSKLILRDPNAPGGASLRPVTWQGQFRIPSSVLLLGNHLIFGADRTHLAGTWFDSVKMRAAAERLGRSVDGPALPPGLSASDVVMLTLYWLMSVADASLLEWQRRAGLQRGQYTLACTVGTPMSFYDDATLRQHFADLARRADLLRREKGPLSERVSLAVARELCEWAKSRVPDGEGTTDYVKSESQAGMWWMAASPTISEGRFIEIDVGAGTTNATLFTLWNSDAGYKQRLHVFATLAEDHGMDEVCRALAQHLGQLQWSALRGKEADFLRGAAANACEEPLSRIGRALRVVWARGVERHRHPEYLMERERWSKVENFKVVVCGGGSLVPEVLTKFEKHPTGTSTLNIAGLEFPPGLEGKLDRRLLPFALVAYGLSDPDMELQVLHVPTEISNQPPTQPRPPGHTNQPAPCPSCNNQNEDCTRCGGKWWTSDGRAESQFSAYANATLFQPPPPKPAKLGRPVASPSRGKPTHPPSAAARPKPNPDKMATKHGARAEFFRRDQSKPTQTVPGKRPPPPKPPRPPVEQRFPTMAQALIRATSSTSSAQAGAALGGTPELVHRLLAQGLTVIDLSARGGCVWVLGGEDLAAMLESFPVPSGRFCFTPNGGRATSRKPAWYWSPR